MEQNKKAARVFVASIVTVLATILIVGAGHVWFSPLTKARLLGLMPWFLFIAWWMATSGVRIIRSPGPRTALLADVLTRPGELGLLWLLMLAPVVGAALALLVIGLN